MKLAPILFVFVSTVCVAQANPPPPPMTPPPGLPIDGAVLFVLILAIIYGVRKKLSLVQKTSS